MGKRFRKMTPNNLSNLRVEIPRTVVHSHSYGKASPYFRAFEEGKLIGTHCKGCALTFLPPRPDCPECWQETHWVYLPNKGEVATFAVVEYPGEGFEKDIKIVGAELPCVIVYVEIPGVDTKIMSRLEGVDPSGVYIGMPVCARFVENPNMNALDLFWVPQK